MSQCVARLCKEATARNPPPRLLRFSALPVFWRGLLEQKPGTSFDLPNINIHKRHQTKAWNNSILRAPCFFGGWRSMYWLYNSCTSFASASLAIFISSFILESSSSARASSLSMSESYPSARICQWLCTRTQWNTTIRCCNTSYLPISWWLKLIAKRGQLFLHRGLQIIKWENRWGSDRAAKSMRNS